MSNREEGLRWVEQAEADLKTASDCLKTENFYASCFFSQQAAEKGLKGILYSQGLRSILTHSVAKLIEEVPQYDKVFSEFIDYAKELDRHYIGSRYPNFYPEGPAFKYYTKEMAEKCLNYATLILENVKKFMKN